jgi:hypothetical protein
LGVPWGTAKARETVLAPGVRVTSVSPAGSPIVPVDAEYRLAPRSTCVCATSALFVAGAERVKLWPGASCVVEGVAAPTVMGVVTCAVRSPLPAPLSL